MARWALAGLLVGAASSLLLCAPAHWLAWGLAQASQGQVLLQQPRGTVWQGSAQLSLNGGAGSQSQLALPGRLQWRLRPAWLGLRGVLLADCCTPNPVPWQAHWRLGGGSLALADHQSRWPAALLSGLGAPWNTLAPQGQLLLDTQGLGAQWTQGRLQLQGTARLDALRVSSRLSTLQPMGSYRIMVQGGSPARLQLETLEGALLLSGQGQWVGQRLRFSGEAQAAPGREAALSNLLNIIGRRNGERSLISIG